MIGFIGGSGIYEALELTDVREERVDTPYGEPSAPITVGTFAGTGEEIAFLPRHDAAHSTSPTDIPYRANVYALKKLGVERVLATNAVGSLKEELSPRSLVIPDQLFDRTRHRVQTFFNDGIVVHASVADPFCPHLVEHLSETAREVTSGDTHGAAPTVREGGTYVCIEGPQFSTRAESEFYRGQGWDVVGMTAVPEAKLAREAELCYATVAGVTDYDVWKADAEVSLEEVLENAAANEAAIKAVVERAIERMPEERECDCNRALAGTINTPASAIDEETRERVALFVDDYLD